jgi:heme oxygenase
MMSLLERLRAETRSQHEQTEQLLYSEALRTGTVSVSQYQHLLLTHLAYHSALEEAIDQHPAFFDAYEPHNRRKTDWLLADLTPLSSVPPVSSSDVFADWTPVELLGAAYVGEGSMLGGKTVWHYLQQSSALLPYLENARFYRGYGPETGQKWRAFGLFVTQQGAPQPDDIVQAAGRAFKAYQTLFQRTLPYLSGAPAI